MFSFFKKKPAPTPPAVVAPPEPPVSPPVPAAEAPAPFAPVPAPAPQTVPDTPPPAPPASPVPPAPAEATPVAEAPAPSDAGGGAFGWLRNPFAAKAPAAPAAPAPAPLAEPVAPPAPAPEPRAQDRAEVPAPVPPAPAAPAPQPPAAVEAPAAAPVVPAAPAAPAAPAVTAAPAVSAAPAAPAPQEPPAPPAEAAERKGWLDRLKSGLRKTGTSITTVFTGTRIDDALYDELEEALLMADTGVKATQWLLTDLKRRVKEAKATDPAAVKGLLADALAELLRPLEKPLVIGEFTPTVIMVAGVNGAGKTTSIGKLTKHLANEGASVLLAAADTFRAAAREQLGVWADRNTVEIVSQEGGDPAAVSFDAVTAGKARGKDVVLVDTAGRLPTQLHLMEELKKIRRVVTKADATAPHEVLLVIDGNTGQNALAQVRAFDDALQLTGLVVTKLDGTAKGGVLAAIAQERPIPVYFIGVGEKLEDLETFSAREFAQALLG